MIQQLQHESAQERAYVLNLGITAELRLLGYPETAINSLNYCGEWDGHYTFFNCACRNGYLLRKRHCDNRMCEICRGRRKFRVFRQIRHFLKSSWNTPIYKWSFFTISPINSKSLDQGLKEIKQKFKKFLNTPYEVGRNSRGHLEVINYVKDKIKGGVYVIEVTKSIMNDYHIHIHGVFYSAFIDFQYKGKCMHCKQTVKLRWDSEQKKPYCANSKCNSYHVIPYEDSKCQKLWRKANNESCRFYAENIKTFNGVCNYLTKYMTMDKTNFQNDKDIAYYLKSIYRQKTLISFGIFYGKKIFTRKFDFICPICGEKIVFEKDEEAEYTIKHGHLPPPKPDDAYNKEPVSKTCVRPRVKW